MVSFTCAGYVQQPWPSASSSRMPLIASVIEAQRDGSARTDIDPAAAAVVIEGMLRGIGYQWLLNPQAFEPTAMVPAVRDAILGLVGRPAGLFDSSMTPL
jgi:hypothetical protein